MRIVAARTGLAAAILCGTVGPNIADSIGVGLDAIKKGVRFDFGINMLQNALEKQGFTLLQAQRIMISGLMLATYTVCGDDYIDSFAMIGIQDRLSKSSGISPELFSTKFVEFSLATSELVKSNGKQVMPFCRHMKKIKWSKFG